MGRGAPEADRAEQDDLDEHQVQHREQSERRTTRAAPRAESPGPQQRADPKPHDPRRRRRHRRAAITAYELDSTGLAVDRPGRGARRGRSRRSGGRVR